MVGDEGEAHGDEHGPIGSRRANSTRHRARDGSPRRPDSRHRGRRLHVHGGRDGSPRGHAPLVGSAQPARPHPPRLRGPRNATPASATSSPWPRSTTSCSADGTPSRPNALEAARTAGVLEERDLAPISGRARGRRRHGRRVRPALGQAARRLPGEGRPPTKHGAGRGAHRRHRAVPHREGLRPAGDGVVRVDRGLPGGQRRPRDRRLLRGRAQGRRREHLTEPDLRLRRPAVRGAVRQRRPEPLGRPALHARAGPRRGGCPSPARTSRPARP